MPARAPGRRSPHTGDAPLIPVIRRIAGPKRTPRMRKTEANIQRNRVERGWTVVDMREFRMYARGGARARHERVAKRQGFIIRTLGGWRPTFGQSSFPFPWARYGSRQ